MNNYLEQLEKLSEQGKFSYKIEENERVIFNIKALSFCVDGLENAVKYGSYIQNNFGNGMVVSLDNLEKIQELYNPNILEDTLETLNYDKDPYIRKLVVLHPNCPITFIHQSMDDVDFDVSTTSKELWKQYINKPKDDYVENDNPYFYTSNIRLELAKNSTNPSELNDLSFCKEYEVRLEVSQNPNINLDTYQKLIKEDDLTILDNLVSNPNCPESILKELSYSKHDIVRESIANNINCPISILKNFSNDDSMLVRYATSLNPNSNEPILNKLSQDDNLWIRTGVARNESTSLKILESLSKDSENDVRFFVVQNPKIPKELLDSLSLDDDMIISSIAMEKINSLNINLKDTIEACSINVDSNESTYKNNHKHR